MATKMVRATSVAALLALIYCLLWVLKKNWLGISEVDFIAAPVSFLIVFAYVSWRLGIWSGN